MMDQLVDKKSLFLRPEFSDFVIIIGDQRLNVHKSVLISSSEYFSALFNSEMIETQTKEISLKETLIKPFLVVLKLSYDIVMTDEEWLELKIQEIFESIVTANKYQFVECEQQLSQKLIDIFGYRVLTVGNGMSDHSMLTIWELLEMAKLHNLMFLIDFCLQFFDENIDYAFKTFDNQFISADILLDVISRDTFGAPEVDIFDLVHKWIQKHRLRSNRKCIEETLLLESVRLTLMSLEQLTSVAMKSHLYEPEVIERITKHELSGDLAQNQRICNESGKLKTVFCTNDLQIRSEQIVVVCVTCILPMPSKVNHLMFTIKGMDSSQKMCPNYWIGIADRQAENGFRKVLDYMKYPCIGEQELFFEEPFVTNSIRIYLECNFGGSVSQMSHTTRLHPLAVDDPGVELLELAGSQQQATQPFEEWRRRSRSRMTNRLAFCDPKLFNVSSIKYEFTKIPFKVMDSCIVPEVNVSQRFGVECYSPLLGHEYDRYLREQVLNNTGIDTIEFDEPFPKFEKTRGKGRSRELKLSKPSKTILKSIDNSFNRLILTPITTPTPMDDSFYIIRLTQPIFADCLQFELVLENEKRRQSDECLAADCKVEISQTFSRGLDNWSPDWIQISEDSYLTESAFYNLEFKLQKVSVIKISGFLYNSDKSLKYALRLKNFSIPADRQSWAWTSGSKLGNESIDMNEVWV